MPAQSGSGERSLPGCTWLSSHCVLTGQRELSGVSSSSGYWTRTAPVGPWLTSVTSLKDLSPNIVMLRVRVLTYEFGRDTTVSIAGASLNCNSR